MAIGLLSYPPFRKKFEVGTLSRHSNGIMTISMPLPSPVRFIISSSAAVSTLRYPIVCAKTTESTSFCVVAMDPRPNPDSLHGCRDLLVSSPVFHAHSTHLERFG